MAKYVAVVVDDFGQTVRGETGIVLDSYTNVYLRFRKAGGTFIEKEGAAVAGDNGNSVVKYDTTSEDALFDTLGEVRVTARAVAGGVSIVTKKADRIMVVEEGEL